MGDVSTRRFNGTVSAPAAVKIIVAGGIGVGKSALVGAVSEIKPLRTEASPIDAVLATSGADGLGTAVVPANALDFGRITIDDALILYLFDTPEQSRLWFFRDEVTVGALGAVVLADPQRLEECVPVIEYFKRHGTPYVVAVKRMDGAHDDQLAMVRRALAVGPQVPVAHCDPRLRESAKNVLITLLEYAKAIVSNRAATATA